MKLFVSAIAGALLLLTATSETSKANFIYAYQGNNFNQFNDLAGIAGMHDNTMSVSGNLVLGTALPANMAFADITGQVISATLSDGRNSLTLAGSTGSGTQIGVSTDATGKILEWLIQFVEQDNSDFAALFEQSATISTINRPGGFGVRDLGNVRQCQAFDQVQGCTFVQGETAEVNNNPGVWTITRMNQIPEPGGLAFLGLAVIALAVRKSAK